MRTPTMPVTVVVALGATLAAQAPTERYKDARNGVIPHTDTHFRMRAYTTLDDWEQRKSALRRQIMTAAGLLPMPPKTPLNAQVFGRIERREYGVSIEKVLLETMPGYYLGGNLYRPLTPGKYPAVLHAHGHDQYGRIEHQHRTHWTAQNDAGQARENRYPDQVHWMAPLSSPPTMAMNLAMQGYVVFTWDMVGYNDTVQTKHTFGGDREKLWSFGPLGLQLWNSIRSVDFVQSLPDVDPGRLGMTGASGGGTQTFLLSAVDERIKAAAPVVMVGGIMQGGSACENAPGLRWDTYNTELAALTAPRALLLVGSAVDQSRNTMTEDYPAVKSVYELYGKASMAEAVVLDAPHNYNKYSREIVARFFARHLRPADAATDWREKTVSIDPPNALLALHNRTLPANALDYEGLFRQWMNQAAAASSGLSAEQLGAGMRAAFGISWPVKVKLEREGGETVLRRERSGDRVPVKTIRGRNGVALVVHEAGASAAADTETVRRLQKEGRSVMLIDPFQTGSAAEPRNFTHLKSRPDDGYYHTFNKSADANRVHDIVTALAYLSSTAEGQVELFGLGKGAVWALFAAAAVESPLKLCVDLGDFQGLDDEYIQKFFVPGIQRAGGLKAALTLTRDMRSQNCGVVRR